MTKIEGCSDKTFEGLDGKNFLGVAWQKILEEGKINFEVGFQILGS